jgi:hypothetical protein
VCVDAYNYSCLPGETGHFQRVCIHNEHNSHSRIREGLWNKGQKACFLCIFCIQIMFTDIPSSSSSSSPQRKTRGQRKFITDALLFLIQMNSAKMKETKHLSFVIHSPSLFNQVQRAIQNRYKQSQPKPKKEKTNHYASSISHSSNPSFPTLNSHSAFHLTPFFLKSCSYVSTPTPSPTALSSTFQKLGSTAPITSCKLS